MRTRPRHDPEHPARRMWASLRLLLVAALIAGLAAGATACSDDGETTTTAGGGPETTASSSGSGESGTTSSDTTVPAPPAGDKLFAALCAGCHGNDGKSGFSPPIAGAEADDVRQAVTQGTGDMQGFGDKLSAAEIDAIVVYVGTLQ